MSYDLGEHSKENSNFLKNIQNIMIGFRNLVWKNPEVEKIAMERIKICASCKELKDNGFCGLCGCYVAAKIRVPEEQCKIGLWLPETKHMNSK